MQFSLNRTMEVLAQTPDTISQLTSGLGSYWTHANEGEATWSVYDVVGHLLHGDKTDWLVRAKIILSHSAEKNFAPFDRFAQFENSNGKTLTVLLAEFNAVRKENLQQLKLLKISEADLSRTGIHPTFGHVTLSQLLATWAVHDLDHIAQIARVMARQYKEETGPWIEFLKILKQ